MSLWEFAGQAYLEEADNAAALSAALLPALRQDIIPLTPGAGLIWHEKSLFPFVFANYKFVPIPEGAVGLFSELSTDNLVRRRIIEAMGGTRPWFTKIRVRSITQPRSQLSPADVITKPNGGTVGCQLTWSSKKGFLTAGHVAPNKNDDVYTANGKVGTVVWANNPAGHGTAVEPDVAVVECAPGVNVAPRFARSVKGMPNDNITVRRSGKSDNIKGFSEWVFLELGNQITATVGDTYSTTNEITTGGDSGGPVTIGADLVGHVVGASPGWCSYIQSVDYQLREATTRAGLGGLSL